MTIPRGSKAGRTLKRLIIRDAHQRAIKRQTERQESTMTSTLAAKTETQAEPPTVRTLTKMQIGILARGMHEQAFVLGKSEAGRSSGFLVTRGLIKLHKKGVYSLTAQGRATYQLILEGHAAALDFSAAQIDAFSGINLNDVALVEDASQALAEQRLHRITQLEKTIDELGELIDQRDTQIEGLRRRVSELQAKPPAHR